MYAEVETPLLTQTWLGCSSRLIDPKGPDTPLLGTLVPKPIAGMVFGSRVLKWAVGVPFWDWLNHYAYSDYRLCSRRLPASEDARSLKIL